MNWLKTLDSRCVFISVSSIYLSTRNGELVTAINDVFVSTCRRLLIAALKILVPMFRDRSHLVAGENIFFVVAASFIKKNFEDLIILQMYTFGKIFWWIVDCVCVWKYLYILLDLNAQ